MRRKKESKRPFVIGFAVTVVILSSLFIGLVLTRPAISVSKLPDSIPNYSAIWGTYVPDSALLFGFENYTAIRAYNSSYPSYSVLLNILDLKLVLKPAAINSVITVSFAHPNESVAFAFVNQAAFSNFTDAFSKWNSTAVQAGSSSMYYVRNILKGQIQFGWLALIPADRGIAFAVGDADAKEALQMCLTLKSSDALITRLDVRQMLYVTSGPSRHLALGIQHFAGIIPSANNTLTVIDPSGSQVQIRRVLEFNSTDTAVAQYQYVQKAYLNAHQFEVFSSFVLATEFERIADLTSAIRLVE